MGAYPVVNQLVKWEENADGVIVLHIPRRMTGMARFMIKTFKVPTHRRVELDELGTFVLRLCDGEHTVRQIIGQFSRHYRLNPREAEVSMIQYLKILAQRGIIGLAVPTEPGTGGTGPASGGESRSETRSSSGGGWKKRKRGPRRKKRG
jgi:hypothetical protein